jgi:hypothetical protein
MIENILAKKEDSLIYMFTHNPLRSSNFKVPSSITAVGLAFLCVVSKGRLKLRRFDPSFLFLFRRFNVTVISEIYSAFVNGMSILLLYIYMFVVFVLHVALRNYYFLLLTTLC